MSQSGILAVEDEILPPNVPTSFITDSGTAIPAANILYVLTQTLPAGTTPLQTTGLSNVLDINIQLSQAVASSSSTYAGLSSFDSSFFSVDANGYVSFTGSANAGTITGNSGGPLSQTANNWNIYAGLSAAGTTPVTTSGLGSTLTIKTQISQAIAATDSTKIGLASFDSAAFDVDANGFVQLNGGGIALTSVTVDANTAPGTNPVVPTASGGMTIEAAAVAAHSVPIETRSRAANIFKIEVQESAAVAATDATKSGISHFDSASFAVDANGFVTFTGSTGGGFTWNDVSGAFSPLKNNGYFITGTATGTLPALPSQGDTIKFFVDHASQVLTIQATGTQIIRLGVVVSSAGGTMVSTLRGDSVELTYRASDTCWCAIAGFTGTWVGA